MPNTRATTRVTGWIAVIALGGVVTSLSGCSSLLPTRTVTVTVAPSVLPSAAEAAGAVDPSAEAAGDLAAAGPTEVDVCPMFSKAEAEKLAGTPLGKGEAASGSCIYNSPPTGPTAQVSVFVGAGAKQTLDTDRGLDHKFETIPGVGEEAYLEETTIFVRVGQTWGEISLVRFNDTAANRKPLIAAATLLASRM
jgi:hypothetical protein